jgi:hypothetical protein
MAKKCPRVDPYDCGEALAEQVRLVMESGRHVVAPDQQAAYEAVMSQTVTAVRGRWEMARTAALRLELDRTKHELHCVQQSKLDLENEFREQRETFIRDQVDQRREADNDRRDEARARRQADDARRELEMRYGGSSTAQPVPALRPPSRNRSSDHRTDHVEVK